MRRILFHLCLLAVVASAGCATGSSNSLEEEQVVSDENGIRITRETWLNPHAGYYTKFFAENRSARAECVHLVPDNSAQDDYFSNFRGLLPPNTKERLGTWDQERPRFDYEVFVWTPRNGVCRDADRPRS